MTFSSIRKFLGAVIQSFGFASLFISDWILAKSPDLSVTPDAARGLIYACHPKGVAWYYSAFTVVKSWDFVFFGLIFFLGLVMRWEDDHVRRGVEGFVKSYGKSGLLAILIGAVLAFWFGAQYETSFVEWLLAKGFGPPALPCFPFYAGV
jgi:hypothetical protein